MRHTSEPNHLILIATSNRGKLAEFRLAAETLLQNDAASVGNRWRWSFESFPALDSIPECEEDGDTFSANARKKAVHYSRFTNQIVLADDSGLCVDALGGAPGVRSRRYAGDVATDRDNNEKLMEALDAVPEAKRTARFVCVLALAQAGEVIQEFYGTAEGTILREPRGTEGFGYDPLFLDPSTKRTFAEIDRNEKLARSHRGRAIAQMIEWLALNRCGEELE